jgi:transposase-like protein
VDASALRAPAPLNGALVRAENATLKMEREILKKATAFFAKESK